jgi:hypothetical protein
MADRPDLERELRDLAVHVDWPDADLVAPVSRRLRHSPVHPARQPFRWRLTRPVAAAIAAPVVAALVLAASPAARSTVADWLGVSGERIHVVAHPPTTQAPTGGTPARPDLGLGPPLTLSEARTAAGFNVLVPTLPGLTHPDEVHVARPPTSGEIALVYDARADLPAAGTTGAAIAAATGRVNLQRNG